MLLMRMRGPHALSAHIAEFSGSTGDMLHGLNVLDATHAGQLPADRMVILSREL